MDLQLDDPDATLDALINYLHAARANLTSGGAVMGKDTGDKYDDLAFALPANAGAIYRPRKEAAAIAHLGDAARVPDASVMLVESCGRMVCPIGHKRRLWPSGSCWIEPMSHRHTLANLALTVQDCACRIPIHGPAARRYAIDTRRNAGAAALLATLGADQYTPEFDQLHQIRVSEIPHPAQQMDSP